MFIDFIDSNNGNELINNLFLCIMIFYIEFKKYFIY